MLDKIRDRDKVKSLHRGDAEAQRKPEKPESGVILTTEDTEGKPRNAEEIQRLETTGSEPVSRWANFISITEG